MRPSFTITRPMAAHIVFYDRARGMPREPFGLRGIELWYPETHVLEEGLNGNVKVPHKSETVWRCRSEPIRSQESPAP